MGLEIERKFLVKNNDWKKGIIQKSVFIKQAYLSVDPHKTVRIRTDHSKGYITVKGKTTGIARLEFEYEIPLHDAFEMIDKLTVDSIEKVRHYIDHGGKTWELDEFKGRNQGLIIAEIELKSADEKFTKPSWIDCEVTTDARYANSHLVSKPYTTW